MIRKVALVQAHREAYPKEYAGLPEYIGDVDDVIGEAITVVTPEGEIVEGSIILDLIEISSNKGEILNS